MAVVEVCRVILRGELCWKYPSARRERGWEPVRLVTSEGIEETEPAVRGWAAFGW